MGCSGRSFAVEGFRRRNRLCMGCSGRSFAVEGSRRGKPVKSRVANFSRKKRGSTFEVFLAVGIGCSGRSFAVEGSRRGKPLKSRVANFSKKKGTLLLGFSGCGKKRVMDGM